MDHRLKILGFFGFFRPTQKIGREGPKWGREGLFPALRNFADILGRTDFDFENFYFWVFFGSQIFGLGPAWAHLGPAWAHPLGPRVGPPTWAPRGPTHLGPTWAHPLGPLGWAGGPLGWAPRVGPRVGRPLGWALGWAGWTGAKWAVKGSTGGQGLDAWSIIFFENLEHKNYVFWIYQYSSTMLG